MKSRLQVLVLLFLTAFCASAFAANPARPGTVNYVEGAVSLQGKPINQRSVGYAALNSGEVLATGQGKAEILLTPGIFLRLGENSALRMISPNLTFTQVALERGKATVEVDQIYPENHIQVVMSGVATEMLKPGFYEFNAENNMAMVFKGKAAVNTGENRWRVIKGHHQLAVNAAGAQKPESFNTHAQEGDLYHWSSLRSQYLSQANIQLAQQYGGAGYAPGWYWDPYFWGYTFWGPYPFFSPFGWGFYPFGYFGGGYYGGYGYHGYHGGYGGYHGGVHGGYGGGGGGGFHGGGGGGGVHGGYGGGGGGGFHGGGGGGGFHGGGGGGGGGHR